jgi:hypothetical protein
MSDTHRHLLRGAVGIEVSGALEAMGHCHCQSCRVVGRAVNAFCGGPGRLGSPGASSSAITARPKTATGSSAPSAVAM